MPIYQSRPDSQTITDSTGGSNSSFSAGGEEGSLDTLSANLDPGSELVTPEIPGDLGTRSITVNTALLVQKSLRSNASENTMRPWNHRFRGHRESFKFNLALQQLLVVCAKILNKLINSDQALIDAEQDSYITESDIATIYHVLEQQRFIEWMLLKDSTTRWYF